MNEDNICRRLAVASKKIRAGPGARRRRGVNSLFRQKRDASRRGVERFDLLFVCRPKITPLLGILPQPFMMGGDDLPARLRFF
jgi:hypothetical protein